jgi:hypothetical protein
MLITNSFPLTQVKELIVITSSGGRLTLTVGCTVQRALERRARLV